MQANELIERRNQRHPVSFRVRSRALPHFQATTVNISRCGVQLKTASALPVGECFSLELELEEHTEPLECQAVVRWSKLSNPYHAGLEFLDLEPAKADRLCRFLERHSGQNSIANDEATRLIRFIGHSDVMVPVEAHLKNVVCLGDRLSLALDCGEQTDSWVFDDAQLLTPEVIEGPLSHLLIRPLSRSRFEYMFLGPSGTLQLSLSAAQPYRRGVAAQEEATPRPLCSSP